MIAIENVDFYPSTVRGELEISRDLPAFPAVVYSIIRTATKTRAVVDVDLESSSI
jgi:hypothetical protein